jgi:carboxyl-terminal processing protease
MKKNKKLFIAGFSTTLLLSMFLFSTLNAKANVSSKKEKSISRLEALTKLTKVISIVEKYYVDNLEINAIVSKALAGLMSNLDAHSSFLDMKHFENMKIQTEGEFGGLGITVGVRDGALTIISPIEGTPADKVGLKAEDIILKINNKSTIDMTIDEAVSLMRGKVKTSIDLSVVRKGELKPLKFTIIRDIIKINSVYSKTIGDDILYLRVASFDKKVVKDIKKALKNNKNKAKGIILDLRNNPGGLLDQAVGLVDIFVEDGVIVSQKGRDASEDKAYFAHKSNTYKNIPMIVLINAGSASASEIVSGALQDHKRAIVIGKKSFGKGSVQVILPIAHDEAIKITIARYYLPSGRTIQAVGVSPDVEVDSGIIKMNTKESFSIKESDLKKHLTNELAKIDGTKKIKKVDDKKIITKKQIYNDAQLKSGIDILKALIITAK